CVHLGRTTASSQRGVYSENASQRINSHLGNERRMSISIDLSGKVALITGASQGIGAQTAITFHRAGANVVINHPDAASTQSDAEALAAKLNDARAGSAMVARGDVSDAQAVQNMMIEIKGRLGGIDFLINNAGIIRDRTIAKMPLEEWHAV